MISSNLRRITIQLAAGFMLVAGSVLPAYAALPGIVLSGRVVNTSTGNPIAGVQILTCTANSPVTDANGHWQTLVPTNTLYCARVGTGVPSGLTGPLATNINLEIKQAASYEHQEAGVNCYHNSVCTADLQIWDRSYDGGLDFAFRNAPVKSTAPTPVKPAPPVPAPPAAVTPVPTPTPTPAPAPSPEASAAPTSAVVSFASDDRIATVEVPTKNVPSGAVCTVNKTDSAYTISGKTTVAGDYELKCTSQIGESVDLTVSSVAWQFHLKDLLHNLYSPQAGIHADNSTTVTASFYDKKTNILSFTAPAGAIVFAVASTPSYSWVNILAVVIGLILLIAFILFFPLRVHRRRSYREYLRSKYYDL